MPGNITPTPARFSGRVRRGAWWAGRGGSPEFIVALGRKFRAPLPRRYRMWFFAGLTTKEIPGTFIFGRDFSVDKTLSLVAPPHHVDFVMDEQGNIASTGPGAAAWLGRPGVLGRLREILATTPRSDSPRGWWAAAPPVHFRFVPLESADGVQLLTTVVPPRAELTEALELLTPTQQMVAEYAAAGATITEIAVATGRRPETVRSHVKEIYRRLSICTRLELQWLMRRPAISYETEG